MNRTDRKKRTLTRDFTTGSIPKLLTGFMLPFMASNALQVLYSVVDMIIVGRYVGSAGLTAVSQGSMYVLFMAMLALGFFTAGQIMTSQLMGAGRTRDLPAVEGSFFASALLISAAITGIGALLQKPVLLLLSLPGEALPLGKEYITICLCGLFFVSGYNALTAVMKGLGDSKYPFVFIMVAAGVNLVLDLIFVGSFGWGVAGAAWATVIGQAASFLVTLLFFIRHRSAYHCDLQKGMFRIRKEIFRRIFSLGVPLSIQAAAINITMMFVNRFVNSLGIVAASATFGAGTKLDDISNKISLGVQFAAAPMIGQNYGAGSFERVKKTVYWTWLFSAIIAAAFMVSYLLFGREMFSLFVDDPQVLDLSRTFIMAVIWSFPGMTVMRGSNALLQGIGNTRLLMVLSFGDSIFRAVSSYFFGITLNMGFYGFVLGFALAPYAIGIPGMVYFFRGKWKIRSRVLD